MNEIEFEKRIRHVDEELKARGLLPHQRPWHAITLVDPNFSGIILGATADEVAARSGPYEGPNLFRSILRWYERMYGDRMKGIGPISRVPLLIRAEVYMGTIPLVFGLNSIPIRQLFRDVTDGLWDDLSDDERGEICRMWREGYELEYELSALSRPQDLPDTAKIEKPGVDPLFKSAIQDRDAALAALAHPRQFPTATFHAQQFGEKSLKAVLRSVGTTKRELKRIGHKIRELYEAVCDAKPIFQTLNREAIVLGSVGMDVRYDNPTLSSLEVVNVYWAALGIAGLSATTICTIGRRVYNAYNAPDSSNEIQRVAGVLTYRPRER